MSGVVCSTLAPDGAKNRAVLRGLRMTSRDRPELVERLDRQHARAVDGIAAGRVFLVDGDVEAFPGQQTSRFQAARAAADDEDVSH